jgi:hypothetical protein
MNTIRLPNFLVVGAAKAGTTWLHACCDEHPEVFVPALKEINYFSRQYHQGLDWYASFFRAAGAAKAVGEISPSYLVTPEVPSRIQAWNPAVRLLFVLRDPIERAYSHYCMLLRAGAVGERPEEVLTGDHRLVIEGLYSNHLQRFLECFSWSQICVLIYEDLRRDSIGFLRQAFGFLGVDPEFRPSVLGRPFHARQARPRYPRTYNALVLAAKWIGNRSGLGKRWIERFRRRGYAEPFHRLNRGPGFPPLSPELRARLAEFYAEDVGRLSVWLERDLSFWLQEDPATTPGVSAAEASQAHTPFPAASGRG